MSGDVALGLAKSGDLVLGLVLVPGPPPSGVVVPRDRSAIATASDRAGMSRAGRGAHIVGRRAPGGSGGGTPAWFTAGDGGLGQAVCASGEGRGRGLARERPAWMAQRFTRQLHELVADVGQDRLGAGLQRRPGARHKDIRLHCGEEHFRRPRRRTVAGDAVIAVKAPQREQSLDVEPRWARWASGDSEHGCNPAAAPHDLSSHPTRGGPVSPPAWPGVRRGRSLPHVRQFPSPSSIWPKVLAAKRLRKLGVSRGRVRSHNSASLRCTTSTG